MNAGRLRSAATLMRERAEAARSGRWFAEGDEVRADWTSIRQVATCRGSLPEGNEANASHIASWHPAVALAVADWMDSHAGDLERAGGHLGSCDSPGDTQHALAVAEAYLGEVSA